MLDQIEYEVIENLNKHTCSGSVTEASDATIHNDF